jgi:hypothetical protein
LKPASVPLIESREKERTPESAFDADDKQTRESEQGEKRTRFLQSPASRWAGWFGLGGYRRRIRRTNKARFHQAIHRNRLREREKGRNPSREDQLKRDREKVRGEERSLTSTQVSHGPERWPKTGNGRPTGKSDAGLKSSSLEAELKNDPYMEVSIDRDAKNHTTSEVEARRTLFQVWIEAPM